MSAHGDFQMHPVTLNKKKSVELNETIKFQIIKIDSDQ